MAKKEEIAVIGLRGFPDIQGGVEKHCEALYPRIKSETFRVYRRRPFIAKKAEKSYPNIRFSDLPSTRIAGFEATFHTFLASVACGFRRPKAVHVHNIGPGLFIPLLKLFGLKVVMTYHSNNYEHEKWGAAARAILRLGERLSVRWADRIIFVNRKQFERLSPVYPGKCIFMPNGVNPMAPAENDGYIRSLGAEPGRYLLAVGRLTPEKGFDHLVRAVNLIDEDVRLIIAGGSDNNDEYARLLRERDTKGRVIFTGNVQGENLRQLYTHARLYILSSINEGFPLVLLEAMQQRLPVLASDIPASHIPGITRFFRPADPESLATALGEYLAAHPATEREDYDLSPYDWDTIARQTLDVYTSI